MPTVGTQISRSLAISPGLLVPISMTAAPASSGSPSMDWGRPMKLFQLRLETRTFQRDPRMRERSSRVVVLPFEPVTATQGMRGGRQR